MKYHLETNVDPSGNLWCHMEGCRGTHTPYRINPDNNRNEGRQMVDQQVKNILHHLSISNKIRLSM